MELKCFICEGRVDAEAETTFFFECHVYCDKCLEEMERSNRALWGRGAAFPNSSRRTSGLN